MKMIIKNGRVINPATNTDAVFDILVEDGIIKEISESISREQEEQCETVIDAGGCFCMPGLIDLHTHLREPGYEHKETMRTGARAAARGGFTTICAMPSTKPVIDSLEMVEYIIDKANDITDVNILPIAAMTAAQEGEYITDFEKLYSAGVVGFSEDGCSVADARVARQAMRLAAEIGAPVFAHCEDKKLAARGVMNAGNRAKELGLFGIMNAVEDTIIARDLILAKNTGVKLHISHCSTADGVRMIALAKEDGLDVTAEVTPHHLILTEDDITGEDTNYKTNPPLRSKKDREALIKGLCDGTIDVISSDHAPHHPNEKAQTFEEAPFGVSGLETAVSLIITEFVKKDIITPLQMAEKMSYNPAKILGLDKGDISVGKTADITIINPEERYIIDSNHFASKGKNTPFNGKEVYGQVCYTIVGGRVVYSNRNGNEIIIDKDVARG